MKSGWSSPASTRIFAWTTHSSRSTQCATRSPVSAFKMTVGEASKSESPIVSGVAQPVTVAPGRCVMAAMPGEKPSISLNGSGLERLPLVVSGMAASGSASRRPVTVVESATVK